MKKHFLLAAGVVLTAILAFSCSQESLPGDNASNEALVSLNVSLPGAATRAFDDGYSATSLQYAVYEAGDTYNYVTQGTAEFPTGSLTTTVEVALVKGVTYNLAFWAQSPTATCYEFDAEAQTVTVAYDDATCNEEIRDAFYNAVEYTPNASTGTLDVDLYRPFAQINFLTNDLDEPTVEDYVANMQTSITIDDNAYGTLDLPTGDASNGGAAIFAAADASISLSETSPVEGYDYIAMAYVLVGSEKNESGVYKDDLASVTLNVSSTNSEGRVMNIDVPVNNVPVQRNYRTNIYGALITESTSINVIIQPLYGEYDGNAHPVPYPSELTITASEGADALTFDETGTAAVSLDSDSGAYSFDITTTSSWTVTSDNESFTLEAVTKASDSVSGTGDATITVNYPENTSETAVTAKIAVAVNDTTLTIALTQAAAGEEVEEPAAGDGTFDNPYSVEEALALINGDSCPTEEVYVMGIISSVSSYSSTYGSINYYISDDGTTESDQLYVYGGLGLGGEKFSAKTDIATTVEVIVCGVLTLYNGTTAEITSNNYMALYNGVTDYLYASESAITVSAASGEISFAVTSNVEYTVTSSDETNFPVTMDGEVLIEYTANEGEERSATITIAPVSSTDVSAVVVTITQTSADYSMPTFDSSLEWTLGDKSYTQAATVNETSDVSVLKLGTSSAAGTATMTIPSGSTGISFYGVSWTGKAATMSLTVGSTEYTQDLAVNSGATGNPTYTITVTDSDYYTITFESALTEDTTATVTTTGSNYRIILWGINPVTAVAE